MIADAQGLIHPRAAADARIVSLVPSITELLCDLGLAAQVVGRTGFCVHPRDAVRAIPKLGGTKDVALDALAALHPSHVVVNIDENTRDTYERLCTLVPHVIVTHPNAPADNLALYRLLGTVFGREREMHVLEHAFSAALARLAALRPSLPPRRVLYLIWRRPWMTVGSDTYVSRTLALVNWQTVPPTAVPRYPTLTTAELQALDVDLCLLSSEPYPFRARHVDEVARLLGRCDGIRPIDGEMVSWYGSRAIQGLDYLARYATAAMSSAA